MPIVGSFFRQEPAGKRGEPIVFYKEGGQLRAARFMSGEEGHALYELVTALPAPLRDVWSDLIGTTTSVMRTGITSNPVFMLTNYIRDQMAVAIMRPDFVPFWHGFKGALNEVRQGDYAKLYGYGGGVSAGASIAPVEGGPRDRRNWLEQIQGKAVDIGVEVDALAKKGYLVNRLSSFSGFLEMSSLTEAGTRNSVFGLVFEKKRAQGLSEYEAMIEATIAAQDTLDFSRHGSRTMGLRRYIPFINAQLQGLDRARRGVVSPILRRVMGGEIFRADTEEFSNAMLAVAKGLGVGAAAGAGYAALVWEKEGYRDANVKMKASHFVVPWGNKVVVIPKPFEYGLGFTMGEYAYAALAAHDPRAAGQFASAVWDTLVSTNPLTDVPLVKQGFELALNKSLFTGREIVPQSLQRLDVAEQYTEKTSAVAKWIGSKIGVAPIKVDYAIGSSFGLWGRDIMAMSSGIDPGNAAQGWDDTVFFRRFIKDPSRTSDVTTRFWDYMGQTTGKFNQAVATFDNFNRTFNDAGAQAFLSKLPAAQRAYVILKSSADDNGKPAFDADTKRLHPLQRAYDAVTMLNGLRREISNNAFRAYETGMQTKYAPEQQRQFLESIRELAQMEMRNALVIMKEPGYGGRALLDTELPMLVIRSIDPAMEKEIKTRYATSKIYKTDAVAAAYPAMVRELLTGGSEADLDDLAFKAGAAGYQFDGVKARKPQKRRTTIEGVK